MIRTLGVLLTTIASTHAHAAVIQPAVRYNKFAGNPDTAGPNGSPMDYEAPYCTWTSGGDVSQCKAQLATGSDACLNATRYSRIKRDDLPFMNGTFAINPDDSNLPWVDSGAEMTEWCVGDKIRMNIAIFLDHAGIWRWEYQPSLDGSVTEEAFKNATPWRSFNGDPQTKYYQADGRSEIPYNKCFSGRGDLNGTRYSDLKPWKADQFLCKTPVGTCCQKTFPQVFSTTTWTLPDIPEGSYVFRWRWYGAATTDGKWIECPPTKCPPDSGKEWPIDVEPANFVNCVDVKVRAKDKCGGAMHKMHQAAVNPKALQP